MRFSLKFSMILLITTGFMTTTVKTSPGLKDIFGIGCSAIVGASRVQPCAGEFAKTMANQQTGGVNTLTYCCAVTELRYCVVDKIGNTCGDEAENTANYLVNGIVAAVKFTNGKQPCDGNEFYYRKESPLCWDFWGPLTGIAIVAIMLITICCTCCCCICSSLLGYPPKRRITTTQTYKL